MCVVKGCDRVHLLQLALFSVFPVVVSVAKLRADGAQAAAELGTPVAHSSLGFTTPPLSCHLFNHSRGFVLRNHY